MKNRQKTAKSKIGRGALAVGLVAALSLIATGVVLAQGEDAQESKRVARGKVSYNTFCRSCHGELGRGDGSVAETLEVPPADLTLIARRNGGEFPRRAVTRTIDGRKEVRGHGSREMPVWGRSFQDPGRDARQETDVLRRIDDLVAYLDSLQVK